VNVFRLEPTANTPDVVLQPADGTLHVEGDCYPENPALWFGPIFIAIAAFTATRPTSLRAVFRLRYVNSASTKALRRLFVLLDRAGQAGVEVAIRWEHDVEDDVAQELGELLAEDLHFIDVDVVAIDLAA
jgi:hypothetical protein